MGQSNWPYSWDIFVLKVRVYSTSVMPTWCFNDVELGECFVLLTAAYVHARADVETELAVQHASATFKPRGREATLATKLVTKALSLRLLFCRGTYGNGTSFVGMLFG